MKYRFMREHRTSHSVELMARTLRVSRSGYYAWLGRESSDRARGNKELLQQIHEIQELTDYTYGSPRMAVELRRRGYRAGKKRVARLMRENGLGRRLKKRFRSTTNSEHSLPVAKNLVDRQFEVPRANHTWVSDLTYIATAEGWLYLCVVIDLYSRKVVGWSMSSRMTSDLALSAFMMALMRRRPPEGLIFHSDRGSQYCSGVFRATLRKKRVRQSMSRKGDCWDNAVAEAFFKTLKSELTGYRAYRTRAEARRAIFEYIELFYNRLRLHSTIDYVSPSEFEESYGRVAA